MAAGCGMAAGSRTRRVLRRVKRSARAHPAVWHVRTLGWLLVR
jgi:hypothetical protein